MHDMKYISVISLTTPYFMCNNSVLMVSTMRKKLVLVIGPGHQKEKAVYQKIEELKIDKKVMAAQIKEEIITGKDFEFRIPL